MREPAPCCPPQSALPVHPAFPIRRLSSRVRPAVVTAAALPCSAAQGSWPASVGAVPEHGGGAVRPPSPAPQTLRNLREEGAGGARLGQLSDSHGTKTSSVWLPGGDGRMSGGLRVWQASGGARSGEGVVLEDSQDRGVSPGAGPGQRTAPCKGVGNPEFWVLRPGGPGEMAQAALGSTGVWGDLGHRGACWGGWKLGRWGDLWGSCVSKSRVPPGHGKGARGSADLEGACGAGTGPCGGFLDGALSRPRAWVRLALLVPSVGVFAPPEPPPHCQLTQIC